MENLQKGVSRLNEDLIVEILVRLSVKPLLRFKLVCKFWYDLIKSPNFIHLHLKRSSTRNSNILIISPGKSKGQNPLDRDMFASLHSYESLDLITKQKIPRFSCYWYFIVCGTCNGLLCLSDFKENTLLWNPLIGEYKKIPFHPSLSPERWTCSYVSIGFGFDSITNDCKVVAFGHYKCNDESDKIIIPEIYSLQTNSWRTIELDSNVSHIYHDTVSGPPVNGVLHWICAKKDVYLCYIILSFHLSTEKFGYIELPDDPSLLVPSEGGFEKLTVVNESLALFISIGQEFLDLWVMHEYGIAKSWTRQCKIVLGTRIQRALMFWKNDCFLLEKGIGQLVSCAVDTSKMVGLVIQHIDKIFELLIFHESLVSVA